jgi:hypothetical protein
MPNSSLSLYSWTRAAFDTIGHDDLLERLERWFGLSGPILNWIRTYLTGREFVSLGEHNSEKLHITCGFPKCLILGPVQFIYNAFGKYSDPFHSLILKYIF